MKTPTGKDILSTLVVLWAKQNKVKVVYEIVEVKK